MMYTQLHNIYIYICTYIYIDVRRYVCMYTDIVYIRCITIKIL